MRNFIRKIASCIPSKNFVHIELKKIDYEGLLKGKTAVITGGGKGIGFSIAKKFLSEGAYVLITGRNEQVLRKSVNELGRNSKYLVFDTTCVEQADSFIEQCYDLLGEVDIFVNNAGISLHERNFTNVTTEGFDRQFNTNLKGPYFLAKAYCERKLKGKEAGNLLFISSNTSAKCVDIPYGLSKAAINSFVGALSRRVYNQGIRVNAICPGVVPTDMTKEFTKREKGNYAFDTPSGRLFLPDEIAEVACFIVSDASKCISGEVLFCDAGNHLNVNWK